jgi:hypothetical protein
MGARVEFLEHALVSDGAAPSVSPVIVPVEAVQVAGDTGGVFIIHGDTVERRSVRLGARTADGQAVLSGLSPGEHVAAGDLNKLSDGVRVQVEH